MTRFWRRRRRRPRPRSETVGVRLPKVDGPNGNATLSTVCGFAHHATRRWALGPVAHVAAAMACAALDPVAADETVNLGEAQTPTISARLERLPARFGMRRDEDADDFRRDMHTDTREIRRMLSYADVVDEAEALAALAAV